MRKKQKISKMKVNNILKRVDEAIIKSEKQLRERWLTPEGEKIRKKIIDHIIDKNWEVE